MHSGPIKLPNVVKAQCNALINLGGLLQLYSIPLFVHVMDVFRRIINDRATLLDIQEVSLLCDAILDHELPDELRENIDGFKQAIEMIIMIVTQPDRPCGMWTRVIMPFDDDQLL